MLTIHPAPNAAYQYWARTNRHARGLKHARRRSAALTWLSEFSSCDDYWFRWRTGNRSAAITGPKGPLP